MASGKWTVDSKTERVLKKKKIITEKWGQKVLVFDTHKYIMSIVCCDLNFLICFELIIPWRSKHAESIVVVLMGKKGKKNAVRQSKDDEIERKKPKID